LLIIARLSRKRKIKSKSMGSFKEDKEYNSNALFLQYFITFLVLRSYNYY